jgi:thiol-disulfide isomerase/thioredoxin
MFRRSFLLVFIITLMVFASAFASQMWITKDLPSSYDTGLNIEKAFKTSKAPLLIEFYSDSCGTCRRVTPVIHELQEGPYKNKLTLVMMDVSESSNQDIAQLFGVDALPALYVFDHHHMKKYQIKPEEFVSKETLRHAIDTALEKTTKVVNVPVVPATTKG